MVASAGDRARPRAASRMAESSIGDSPLERRPILDVWQDYRRSGERELRDYLIEKHLYVVRRTAERLHPRLPSKVDVEDLMSAGLFGLIAAIDSFDPDRQVKFQTYCAQRIHGAMIDELRTLDWASRTVRVRQAKMDKARRAIEMECGRPATISEIAARLGVSPEEFARIERDSRVVGVISMSAQRSQNDGQDDAPAIDLASGDGADNPMRLAQRKDLRDLITRGLSRAERLIVLLYYYEGLTMKEVGVTLALSESRVSQMHSSILLRLKAQMREHARELEPAR